VWTTRFYGISHHAKIFYLLAVCAKRLSITVLDGHSNHRGDEATWNTYNMAGNIRALVTIVSHPQDIAFRTPSIPFIVLLKCRWGVVAGVDVVRGLGNLRELASCASLPGRSGWDMHWRPNLFETVQL
jgi:hypothetical protein